jgi:dihydrofolate reductase
MRKLITAAFVTLDGIMQAPGGRQEDPSDGFRYGGWVVPFADPAFARGTAENFGRPFDLVLGHRTYDMWAGYWPKIDADSADGTAEIANAFNRARKHVAARSRPELPWQNSQWLGKDAAAAVARLKEGNGPDLLTQGSGDFVQALLAADLVDELRLLTFPVTLGTGKRLWGEGVRPAAFRMTRSQVTPGGVIIAAYERDGEVRTGSFGPAESEPT